MALARAFGSILNGFEWVLNKIFPRSEKKISQKAEDKDADFDLKESSLSQDKPLGVNNYSSEHQTQVDEANLNDEEKTVREPKIERIEKTRTKENIDNQTSITQSPSVKNREKLEETVDVERAKENSASHVEEIKTEETENAVEIDFDIDPTFAKNIRTKASKKDGKPIFGLTVLNEELFTISQHSQDIEVYDSKSLMFKQQFRLESLFDPVDIRSCKRNRCLYIFDWEGETNEILKVTPDGQMIKKWSTGQNGGFLSITNDGNVMLSVWDKNLLQEYSPEGHLIREVTLPSGILDLRLGIELTNGNYLVCHGEEDDGQHSVCSVDTNGVEIGSFGGSKGFSDTQFDNPNYMVVDKNGFVLVADQNNKRVVLLSADLKFLREVSHEADGLRYPVRMDLDQSTGRLFIAENDYLLTEKTWRDGRIVAFDFKIKKRI